MKVSAFLTVALAVAVAATAAGLSACAAEPKGEIVNHDVTNGRYEAEYTHTSGTGTPPSSPTVSGTQVVSAPISKTSPENDYTTFGYTITDSLTGTVASSS